ncbi:hypothetical protein [Mesorhizobium sp.]|uniref:hypothetical protein n=1 Tax=Mesorhizobium sp. TaxID=1871066 RepID=UPI0025F7ACE1|nr:hypothetical protein [Mesorhizobium sp.]
MDEDHLLSAVRYVGLNPVRAGLVKHAADWPWSSARAHQTDEPDGVADLRPMKDRLPSSTGLFDLLDTDAAAFDALRKAESIGRPVGNDAFLDRIAEQIGKAVKPGKRGRRRKKNGALSP